MERHFEKELESLKTTLITMAHAVEVNFRDACQSVLDGDSNKAQEIITREERINALELEIDNAVIDLLALQQPVAVDLRFIIAAQKISNDMERIGDHAVNIAQSTMNLDAVEPRAPLLLIPSMIADVGPMLHDAFNGFSYFNTELAQTVLQRDDEVDHLNREMTKKVIDLVRSDSTMLEGGLELIRISRNLERVADLSTNIAEEVIFYIKARFVKHNTPIEDQLPR
jgi:phosphate transport system protein